MIYYIMMNSKKFVYNTLPRLIDVLSHNCLITIRKLNRTWMYLFRTVNISRITDRYESRADKMKAFQAYLMYLPVQGSPEWLAQRSGTNKDFLRELLIEIHGLDPAIQFPPTVGGSEIASLLGEDKYKNSASLLRGKLGIEKFDGNVHTNWGKMFEEVIRSWTELVFSTQLLETGSVPGLRNEYSMPVQSYSPDGIGIIAKDRISMVLERENIKFTQTDEYREIIKDDRIVLFEFKCPLMRKPTGTVPPQYRAQPKLGMATLGIPEFAIFGDATFRKCSVDDFNFEPSFDLCMPPTARDKARTEKPIALGFIGVYEAGGRSKTRGTDTDMKAVTKFIHASIPTTVNGRDYVSMKHDVNLMTLVAVKLYDSAMDNEFEQIEFNNDMRIKILWNAIRSRTPNIQNMDREQGYKIVYDAIRLIDAARTDHNNLNDLSFGIDFGYTKYSGDKFGEFEVYPPEKMQDVLSGTNVTLEEFYNLMVHANTPDNQLGLKFYYPGKFCYQASNPYALDLATNKNDMDGNLKSSKQCRKWLWQNVREFEQFCFIGGHKSVGIIPYKLLNIKYTPIYKESNFLERVFIPIKEFQTNLEKCRTGTSDPVVMDRRVCEIFNIAPLLTTTIEPNVFDDVDLEHPMHASGNIGFAPATHDVDFTFDDLELIG